MAKSGFWQKLAEAFDALKVHSGMRAEWHYIVGSGFRQWGPGGRRCHGKDSVRGSCQTRRGSAFGRRRYRPARCLARSFTSGERQFETDNGTLRYRRKCRWNRRRVPSGRHYLATLRDLGKLLQ